MTPEGTMFCIGLAFVLGLAVLLNVQERRRNHDTLEKRQNREAVRLQEERTYDAH